VNPGWSTNKAGSMKSCDYSSLQFLSGVYWSLILRLPFSYYEERMCDCRGTAGLEGNGQGGLRYHKPEGTVELVIATR